jgi:hypothetical protein
MGLDTLGSKLVIQPKKADIAKERDTDLEISAEGSSRVLANLLMI